MPDFESQTIELCDAFMDAAERGELDAVATNLTHIVEFAACMVARSGKRELSLPIFAAARAIENCFDSVGQFGQRSRANVVEFRLG